jgi:hypothetical protein
MTNAAAPKLSQGARVRLTSLPGPFSLWLKPGMTGTVRIVRRTRSALPVSVEIDGAGPAEGRPLAHVDPRHVEVIAAG